MVVAAIVAVIGMVEAAQAAPGSWSRTAPQLIDFPRDIDVSPTDPNTVYVALGDGGIARSTDGGSSWVHLGRDNGLTLAKGVANDLEVDPNSPQTVYVAGDSRVSRSLDGGATFNPVGTPGAPGRSDVLDTRAGAGPADTTVIAGGVLGRVFLSTDSGNTWADKTGNLAFQSVTVPGFIHVNAIELHPTDPNVAFASSGGVLARTTNLTNASPTWTAIQAAPLTGSISDLEAVSGDEDRLVVATFTGGVLRSENAGDSATATPTWFTTPGLTGGVVKIASIGNGGDGFLAASSNGVFKTDDLDAGWSELGGGLTGGDSSAVGVAPSDNAVYYLHSGKVIFRSANGGISSTPRPGVVASQVSHLATAGGRVWAGSNDQLLVTDDGETWSRVPAADPFETAIVAAAPSAPDTILIAGSGGQIRRSTNAGASFGAASATSPAFVADLAFDPGNASLAYAAAFFAEVSVSTDGGLTWTPSSTGFPGAGEDFDAEEIEVAAPVGAGPGVVFVGSTNTNPPLFASANGGASWTPASTGLPANGEVEDLTADPSNPSVVYAVIDGPGLDPALYRTVNGGGTWTELPAAEASVPDSSFSIREVGVSPRDGRIVISADDVGTLDPPVVTVSTDGGASFNPISPPIQHNFGSPRDIIFDDQAKGLHIATDSSGLLDYGFVADVSATLAGPATATVGDDLALTATVTAGGPDLVTGLRFELPLPTGMVPLSANPSAGTCTVAQTISCQLGAPATGAPVTIAIGVRTAAAGNQALTGTASGNQADTNPANNQGPLAIAVSAPPDGEPPPQGNDPINGELSLKLKPAKDDDAPFVFRASGALSGAGLDAAVCSGKVKLSVKKGRNQVLSKSVGLKFARGRCAYAKQLRFRRAPAKKLKVQASFAGSDTVTAATSKAAKITLG